MWCDVDECLKNEFWYFELLILHFCNIIQTCENGYKWKRGNWTYLRDPDPLVTEQFSVSLKKWNNLKLPVYSILFYFPYTAYLHYLPASFHSSQPTYIPATLLTFLPSYLLTFLPTYLLTYLCTCSPCSPNNTIITITCQFYCLAIASTDLCELVQR